MNCNGLFTLHGNGTGTGTGPGAMGPNVLYGNVHTGLRLGKEQDPLFSIVLVQYPVPVPVLETELSSRILISCKLLFICTLNASVMSQSVLLRPFSVHLTNLLYNVCVEKLITGHYFHTQVCENIFKITSLLFLRSIFSRFVS